MRTLLAGLLVFAIPVPGQAQSLGSAAEKEKQRRQKNKEAGVQARVVTDEQMAAERPEAVASPSPSPPAAASTAPTQAESAEPDSSQVRRQQEEQWRARMAKAQARLDAARKRHEAVSQLYMTHGEYYVDDKGRTVIASAAQLQQMVAQAKAELDAAQRALENLEEDARRAGVPPGWLR